MVYYQEPDHAIYYGHALDILKGISSESVDICMTSPPYWGLRTYKTEPIIWGNNHCKHAFGEDIKVSGHHSGETNPGLESSFKDGTEGFDTSIRGNFCLKCRAWRGELGLEPTIELYIQHLVLIFNEVKRVLKKTGTCWVNLDDSYAGGKGQSGCGDAEYQANRTDATLNKPYHQMGGHGLIRPADGDIGVPVKSLCLIPQRFAIAMVGNGWILRNDIVWNKPNPMPESVKDRFTGSWEHLFFFVKSKRYFFEQQFEAHISEPNFKICGAKGSEFQQSRADPEGLHVYGLLGRNKRDVWVINTQPYPEAHFATFPEKLCETPILAGCPSMICKKCGKAREKEYQVVGRTITEAMRIAGCDRQGDYQGGSWGEPESHLAQNPSDTKRRILESMGEVKECGYTDCGCNAGFEAGVLLDPFTGSGTVQAVAKRLGRKSIGIELNPNYCKLAAKRLQEIPLPMVLVCLKLLQQ